MIRTMRRGVRGFTLIEVMVAMTLLLIGILAIVTQWPTGARLAWHSEWQTEASTLAERTLESLDAGVFPPTSGTATVGRYTIIWTIIPGRITNTVLADVVVRWVWEGRNHQVRMGTLLCSKL